MTTPRFSTDEGTQTARMQTFYRFQSRIYDWTRWAFLFGRKTVLRELKFDTPAPTILEVGCGTGKNLVELGRRFPKANLIGLDVSAHMLEVAARNLRRAGLKAELICKPYGPGAIPDQNLDAILFSYSLTMINPQWPELVAQAQADLKPGGQAILVDFHDTGSRIMRWHMHRHHVRIDGHLLPAFQHRFNPVHTRLGKAYMGWWRYVEFVGRKPATASQIPATSPAPNH